MIEKKRIYIHVCYLFHVVEFIDLRLLKLQGVYAESKVKLLVILRRRRRTAEEDNTILVRK